MPLVRTLETAPRGEFPPGFRRTVPNWFQRAGITLTVAATLACASCDRPSPQAKEEKTKPSSDAQPSSAAKEDGRKKPYSREGYAVWYIVPVDSLANRRAGKDEFTAAHNHLPLGSMVRVTRLENGESVIVRITDRGITKRGASIDLCKPAAEKLGMISEGMVRVRMEELEDDAGTNAAPDAKAAAANP